MTTTLVQNLTGTDQGMPVCNGTAGSRLAVIRYCLVTVGGWEEVYTNGNIAWFRPTDVASNRLYLRVDDSAAQDARLIGYVTHTAEQDAGTGPFPTNSQVSGGLWLRGSSTANTTGRPWHAVVWEKGIRLLIRHYASLPNYIGGFLFTDLVEPAKAGDAYHTIINGITSTYSGTTTELALSASQSWVAGPYSQSAASTPVIIVMPPNQNSYWFGVGNNTYPSPISGSGDISPVYVFESNHRRGRIPGHWGHAYSASNFSDPLPEIIVGRVIKPFMGTFVGDTQMLIETTDWGAVL